MFYSQFILAKKGPLGTIWIAAHLERKLRKNQVADTDIGVSVDSIIFPEVPIALRLSSHLLLGVVRIYNRKVNYLFDDCSEALLKIKQAFRSTAVDLPPEESKAPYHSITLPETFDLDDFELPDNDILQSNYVDHHISSREQITLQDSMEGVSYSTSKFGLDERFGDGDASGLDLDEELFLDKIGSANRFEDHVGESAQPQASIGSLTAFKHDELYENKIVNLENKVDAIDKSAGLMDYADAPCTPGLEEDPNFSKVQEASAGDDHLDLEYNLIESATKENSKSIAYEDKQDLEWCSHENFDATHQVLAEENVNQFGSLKLEASRPLGESPPAEAHNVVHGLLNESSSVNKPAVDLSGQVNAKFPASEMSDNVMASDVLYREDMKNKIVEKDNPLLCTLDDSYTDLGPNKFGSHKNACRISVLASTNKKDSEGSSMETESSPLEVEVPDHEKSLVNTSKFPVDNGGVSLPDNPISETYEVPTDSSGINIHENAASSDTLFLRPCNLNLERPDATTSGCCVTDADVLSTDAALATCRRDTIAITGLTLKEHNVEGLDSCKEIHASPGKYDHQAHSSNSQEILDKSLINTMEFHMPAPERLLAVPDGIADMHENMLEEVTPKEFAVLDEGDTGSKIITGKKRSFTESTLTEQSLNSVESSRLVRVKRTSEIIPDDDDLLSSILVGRRSSVLNVKPTPPFYEVSSIKRGRSASRSGPPKRKVLMDDIMVLHGDTIRQQLTTTEDIRRVRKKAPCTRPEISMIQKQSLEDEIFLDPILSGMSFELVSLHQQVINLTGIRVLKNDASGVALENVGEYNLGFENVGNDLSAKTLSQSKLAPDNVKNDASHDIAVESLTTPQYSENDMSVGVENVEGFSGHHVAEKNVTVVNCEPLLVSDNEISVPIEKPPLTNNSLEDAYDSQNQIKAADDDLKNIISPQEHCMNEAEEEKTEMNDGAAGTAVFAEPESIGHTDVNDDMAGMIKMSLNETCEKNAFINVDASDAVMEERTDASVETNKDIMDFNHKHSFAGDGSGEKDAIINEESSRFDRDDQGESNFFISGNDTEFLNVDDDDLAEITDDYSLDTEEAQPTENSGWSSRTRAVSKYLQIMFLKEAECGRESLSMDNLLTGKSRKEASRMFFETLVLKTRDYIHVEQHNPLDNITIKPGMRLMKSEF